MTLLCLIYLNTFNSRIVYSWCVDYSAQSNKFAEFFGTPVKVHWYNNNRSGIVLGRGCSGHRHALFKGKTILENEHFYHVCV